MGSKCNRNYKNICSTEFILPNIKLTASTEIRNKVSCLWIPIYYVIILWDNQTNYSLRSLRGHSPLTTNQSTGLNYNFYIIWLHISNDGSSSVYVQPRECHCREQSRFYNKILQFNSIYPLLNILLTTSTSKRTDLSTWTISPDDSNGRNRLSLLDFRTLSDSMAVS
jgi:hypothetical protein